MMKATLFNVSPTPIKRCDSPDRDAEKIPYREHIECILQRDEGQITKGREPESGKSNPIRKEGVMNPEKMDQWLTELRENYTVASLTDTELIGAIEKTLHKDPFTERISAKEFAESIDDLYAMIRGYDILDRLLEDRSITEIMVNRYDAIFVEKDGHLMRVPIRFSSEERYQNLIQKIVAEAGKEVHQRTPITDCRMADGSRVNIVLEPIAQGSAALTIRRFREHIYTLGELVQNGTLSPEAADFLRRCVRAKLNIFISGGTGSGKTTLLNALASEADPEERLISVEDARELNFEGHENWIALEARRANATGEGEISIRDLIRTTLRMRPDRIVVGEVRGKEAIDMLQAMNTGHDGSFSTGHANSIHDMQLRLETMVLSGHEGLPLSAIRQQIGSAIDLFVHVARLRDHRRYVTAIEEPYPEAGQICYHPLFQMREKENRFVLEAVNRQLRNTEKFDRLGIASEIAIHEEKA